MNELDLDINNYSINDIEKFFRLKPNYKYTESDIELKEYQIREQLLNSGHIDKSFKRDLIEFLQLAKEWLVFVKCRPPSPSPSSSTQQTAPRAKNANAPTPHRENEIIQRPDTQFIYSNNSEYFPGKLNPLNMRTISKCLNIDTRFRENLYTTQSSDFVVQLPVKLNKVVSMQLSAFEIPISFYGISASYGNNHFFLRIQYVSFNDSTAVLTEDKTVIVPDGNYTATDLVDTINQILSPTTIDDDDDGCQKLSNPDSIFSYLEFVLDINANGSGTGKVTVRPKEGEKRGANIIWVILDFSKGVDGNETYSSVSNPIKTIGWNLGFIKSYYFGLTKYTAEAIIEPSTSRYIYLAIDDFNNHSNDHFLGIMKDNFMNKDILARISIKASNFSILMENDLKIVSEPRTYFGPVDIQKLRIRLFDEFGNIIHMNHSNYSFCLNFKLLYDL